ncbi:LOW QUALITY PROTEIN: hypothetical protein OSB04_013998 [Centaurea solstitialis]|uniref:non-specific serine/threonine protein kinase n=1 Tax=Centaurea solstitialis TaxID=347529 RepID=A0AA38WQY1_9ASTR|nr:LOW QUALITY PROTEIN: hypothetical protein OSB04_013998 [Centaurea solstitialis]
MALILLHLIFLTIFTRFVAAQQTDCSVPVGASLTATPDVKPWLSPSGDFAFGFQRIRGNDSFVLSIWYDKIPDKTIIWYPQTNATVSRGSKVELTNGCGLVLKDPQGREVWSTSIAISDVACGFMNDTGNFVILGDNSGKIWESFKYPADTILPTQVLETEGEINSRKSKTDFSRGIFQLRMLLDGNLVLNTRDIFSNLPLDAYYISGTYDAENPTNSGYKLIFDAMGYLYILRRNGEKFDLTTRGTVPSGDYYHRATLDSDGVFTQYYYPKNPTANATWEIILLKPEDICSSSVVGSGACGHNSVCSLDGGRPKCECPQGFSLLDSNDPNGDCKPDHFTPTCYEGYRGDRFDFIKLNNTDWPGADYAHIRPSNEESCKISCREDCLCGVAIYRDSQCWKKALPLSNGKKIYTEYIKVFLKYPKDDRPPQCPSRRKDKRSSLILVGSVVLSKSVFVISVWIGSTRRNTQSHVQVVNLLKSICFVLHIKIHLKLLSDYKDCKIPSDLSIYLFCYCVLPISIPMALILLHLIFLTIFISFVGAQQTNCSASVGASLTAADNIIPWLSPSGDFAFGFQRIQGKDNFVLSIWYDKIPDKTIIWYPQTNSTVSRGSKVELTNRRGLVLKDPQGREVWSTSIPVSDLTCGFMNDTGNFVILGNNSGKIWESFKSPADTILPTQVLELQGRSTREKTKRTSLVEDSCYLCVMMVILLLDLEIYLPLCLFSLTISATLINGTRSNLTTTGTLPSGDYYHRATLDSDGVFTQYYYPKNPAANASWEDIWFVPLPKDICLSLQPSSGVCGRNSVCSVNGKRPKCECPQGFSLVDSNDPIGDCKPDFTPTCYEGYAGDQFDFIKLDNINWPGSDYANILSTNEQTCQISCKEDCLCAVALFAGGQCWKKALPLTNGRKVTDSIKVFVKYQKHDRPPQCPPPFSKEKRRRSSLVLVGSILLSTSVFVIAVLTGLICVGFFSIYKKKPTIPNPSSKSLATNLPRFTYQELVEATNGFEDELGRGAFGIVYKGVIGENTVAVKKLNRVVQDGEKEFQTEVNAIARTHHKNLVQLLGYCDDGEQRLLVYEYMNNGTLAAFLFGEMKPNWKQRSYIAVGIAKGLAYLHEECSTQIIHCDIKPQNILLDEYYNAKISDFGLAKLLILDQSHTNTGIRGTKGYVAPEWFRNAPVTVKVDVYSFGVLLLEIVSCRKTVKEYKSGDENGAVILTDWAWDCYQERRLDLVVEGDLEALDDVKKLTTFVKVGLWCVQENPGLRPTMREVVQMLEGVVEVKEPPCPFPFSVTYN